MTIAFWCLLVVVLAPYVLSVMARSQATRADYVDDPRAYRIASQVGIVERT